LFDSSLQAFFFILSKNDRESDDFKFAHPQAVSHTVQTFITDKKRDMTAATPRKILFNIVLPILIF
jgi:hypothetical protein